MNFSPYWDYEPTNAIHAVSPGAYTSDKILNLSTIDEINLTCDVTDRSVVNERRQPVLFSFILEKTAGYKVFCQFETIHFKQTNEPVLNTINFYLENDNNDEVNFSGETLTFTLQLIRN